MSTATQVSLTPSPKMETGSREDFWDRNAIRIAASSASLVGAGVLAGIAGALAAELLFAEVVIMMVGSGGYFAPIVLSTAEIAAPIVAFLGAQGLALLGATGLMQVHREYQQLEGS
jgi:hypothetical protein